MNTRPFALAALLTFATALTGGVSQAQQAAKVYRVGALFNRGPNQGDQDVELLRQGLARRGYVEGSNIVLEARFAEGNLDRLPGFAIELVAMGVDVIATFGGPPTNAAQKATTTIRSSRPWLLTQSHLALPPRSHVQRKCDWDHQPRPRAGHSAIENPQRGVSAT